MKDPDAISCMALSMFYGTYRYVQCVSVDVVSCAMRSLPPPPTHTHTHRGVLAPTWPRCILISALSSSGPFVICVMVWADPGAPPPKFV